MIHILYDMNQIEPIGLSTMVFFFTIVVFQMIGMISHRLMTLRHIVSTRHIFEKKKAFNMKEVLEERGVGIMKDMIQSVEVTSVSLKRIQFI